MGLLSMKPKQPRHSEQEARDAELLCDLDLILEKRVSFKLHGMTHLVDPITTQNFFAFTQGILEFRRTQHTDEKEMNEHFAKIIRSVCSSVLPHHVANMTLIQKSVLLELLAKRIMGQTDAQVAESQKKKPVATELTQKT